jgi:archaellum biogenesis ATPase FlaH
MQPPLVYHNPGLTCAVSIPQMEACMSTAESVLAALQPYHLRSEGQGKYRCNSPFRPDSDSMTFTLVINSPEHGAFQDFHPSANPASGSLYLLAKHLGIPLSATIPVESTKRSFAGGDDYARAHGTTFDELRAWGWRETTIDGRPALEIPTPSGSRFRFLDGAKGKATYKSVSGYSRCWYGLGDNLKRVLEASQPLVLCNGEISTLAARKHGIASLAMTGGEKGEIPLDLLEQLKGFLVGLQNPHILIALDCDKAGRTAARGLERQLRSEGFDTRAVDLSLGAGGDLADFCMIHVPDAAAELLKLPALPPVFDQSKWQFAGIDGVLSLPPIDWLVAGQIPARGLTMVYGASGTYKSFFMLDHAMRLAITGIRVLYIAAEGEYGYRQRLEAYIQHHQQKPSTITFVLGQVDLFDVEESTEFTRLIEAYQPQMVVVDTFAMCSGMAEENTTRDMLTIVNGCKLMSNTLNAVIVVVHHTNAEGKKERGNKALRNSCDTILRLSLEDDLICVQSQKTKDTKAFETYYLAPLVILLGYKNNLGEDVSSVVLLPAEKVIRGDDLSPLQRRVLETLAIEPNATLDTIANTVECDNRGTISKTVSKLVKRNYVEITASGRVVTEMGRKALDADSSVASVASVAADSITL